MPGPLAPRAVVGRLLDALDAMHVLGTEFSRRAWCERFCPGASDGAAWQAWDRFKRRCRAVGLELEATGEHCSAEESSGLRFGPGARALVDRRLDEMEAARAAREQERVIARKRRTA